MHLYTTCIHMFIHRSAYQNTAHLPRRGSRVHLRSMKTTGREPALPQSLHSSKAFPTTKLRVAFGCSSMLMNHDDGNAQCKSKNKSVNQPAGLLIAILGMRVIIASMCCQGQRATTPCNKCKSTYHRNLSMCACHLDTKSRMSGHPMCEPLQLKVPRKSSQVTKLTLA